MRTTATVVDRDGRHLWLQAQAPDRCCGCAGLCGLGFARNPNSPVRLPIDDQISASATVGQRLVLSTPSGVLVRKVIVACAIPLAGLLAGALTADRLLPESWGPFLALLGLAGGTLWARLVLKRGRGLVIQTCLASGSSSPLER